MKGETSVLTVGWKVSTLSASMASVRYRALLPILALKSMAVRHVLFDELRTGVLDGLDALVIVKSFTGEDLALAQEAARRGLPVIFDLCDNIFIGKYRGKYSVSPASMLSALVEYLTAIVVTTESLAEVTRVETDGKVPVHVIPDGVDYSALSSAAEGLIADAKRLKAANTPLSREWGVRAVKRRVEMLRTAHVAALIRNGEVQRRMYRLLRRLAKYAYRRYDGLRTAVRRLPEGRVVETRLMAAVAVPPATGRRILWFGNHGAEYARFGILDLLDIREALESVATEFDVELLVVSNHYEKYLQNIRPFSIRSLYVEWSASVMEQALASADVVVIPNSLDDFSICKSANRAVLALTHGVPVVASSTPALTPLASCTSLDDFVGGLRRYLSDRECVSDHLCQAESIIDELYSQRAIGEHWRALLEELRQGASVESGDIAADIAVVVHLPQDIDLAQPVLEAAAGHGLKCVVWTCVTAFRRWARLPAWAREQGYSLQVLPDDLRAIEMNVFSPSLRAVISITETNLNPHRFAHQVAKLAEVKGIFTATMQHGFENVGLTYGDELHQINKISFASQRVYLWGAIETLHPDVPSSTRAKCLPVGCPKRVSNRSIGTRPWESGNTTAIGIFENLHWHRYSDEYRATFMEHVFEIVKAFPYIDFVLKPHNAGMWLTKNFDESRLPSPNLLVVNPEQERWLNCTAPVLLPHLSGVITTPSTVALDASRFGLPTAVVAGGLELPNYEPLKLLRSLEDYAQFVTALSDDATKEVLVELSSRYVDRVLLNGDAAESIIQDIIAR